jgi:hypothetical protein
MRGHRSTAKGFEICASKDYYWPLLPPGSETIMSAQTEHCQYPGVAHPAAVRAGAALLLAALRLLRR